MHVGVHELIHNVHVLEVGAVGGRDDVADGHHLPGGTREAVGGWRGEW